MLHRIYIERRCKYMADQTHKFGILDIFSLYGETIKNMSQNLVSVSINLISM